MKIPKKPRLIEIIGYFGCFAVMMHASGCTSLSTLGFIEPKVIIVRNNSGTGLSQVDIFEVKMLSGEGGRFGSISPVPKGASQILVRGSSPPPLPSVMGVRWTDDLGREFGEKVSLKEVLTKSNEPSGDALVFEIFQSGRVRAYLERYQ